MNQLELKIPPVALLLIIALMMWGIADLFMSFSFSFFASSFVALLIAFLGVVFALLGVYQFRMQGTTVDPRIPEQSASLVTSGVYQFSRNPMYVINASWLGYLSWQYCEFFNAAGIYSLYESISNYARRNVYGREVWISLSAIHKICSSLVIKEKSKRMRSLKQFDLS